MCCANFCFWLRHHYSRLLVVVVLEEKGLWRALTRVWGVANDGLGCRLLDPRCGTTRVDGEEVRVRYDYYVGCHTRKARYKQNLQRSNANAT